MSRRMVGIILCVFLLAIPGIAADRDPSAKDVKGVPHKHRYVWSIVGGTAVGLGFGAIGGTSGAFKGAFIGGGAASAFYLATHKETGGSSRPWYWIGTNAALGAGIGWTACNCGDGFGIGALIGGGGTALIEAFRPRHKTIAKASPNDPPPPDNPSTQPSQQPSQAPPQQSPPQPPSQEPPQPPPQSSNPQGSNPPDDPQARDLPDLAYPH